jgi:nucleotide-binding universal stress UspA family protein
MTTITPPPILCAVDRSDEADLAARCAVTFAERLDLPVALAHVVSRPAPVVPAPVGAAALAVPALTATNEALEDDGHAFAAEVAASLRREPAVFVARGDTVDELARLTDELGAQMVAVGAHPRGAYARAIRGAVWSRLTATLTCPVLVVGPTAQIGLDGPVVAGFDGSQASERAVVLAAGLAARLAVPLVVATVGERPHELAPLDAVVAARLRQVDVDGRLRVRVVPRRGQAAEELERLAGEERAGLLVVGSRGRGPWSAAALGSVSAALVEVARRPVLIAPAGDEPALAA